MAGWDRMEVMLQHELIQRKEEGYLIHEKLLTLAASAKTDAEIETVFSLLETLEKNPKYPYIEPNQLDKIMENARQLLPIPTSVDFDFFHGAIVGRCIGCSLGKPLETGPYFWESTPSNPGWKNIKRWYEGANQYPIRDYVPAHSRAEQEYGLYVINPLCQKETIRFMDTDDDIRYTLIALLLMEQHADRFTPYDVGKMWHERLPYSYVCTAETQAYLNFAHVTQHLTFDKRDKFPMASLEYVRTHINPYREWIGAQIRCDGYAYVSAGNPLEAARLAYQDASFSHVKNGIYGAMFFAALISAAFACKSVDRCVEQALEVIPKTSRLYQYLQRTIQIAQSTLNQEELVERVWSFLMDMNCTHTINNACCCLASIVFGRGDFDVAVTTAVLFGLDTDCNGATVGSFMGALVGERAIAEHWKKPLNDTIYASMPDFHPIGIRSVATRFFALYHQFQHI